MIPETLDARHEEQRTRKDTFIRGETSGCCSVRESTIVELLETDREQLLQRVAKITELIQLAKDRPDVVSLARRFHGFIY